MKKEALLYEKQDQNKVRCNLCAHRCLISPGKTGICRVRENIDGTLHTLVHGKTISQNVDPIEKKPLYHVYPGSNAYSIATPGCNFRCEWCQNWQISQLPQGQNPSLVGQAAAPEQIVKAAQRYGCRSIAYTYTEPTIFFEYALDTARIARQHNIINIFVTNGYMTAEALQMLQPSLDAANVDLKAFRDQTYKTSTGARLQPVLDSLILMKKLGIWVEVTTLTIPEINDSPAELRDIAKFIAQELSPETPWHVSRYHPSYKSDKPPTDPTAMQKAFQIGKEEGLYHIYLGNLGSENPTTCHHCGQVLINRQYYIITNNNIVDGKCPKCGTPVAGLW